MRIKKYKEFNEDVKYPGPIDFAKLQHYAYAIAILCNGEYGDVYLNEKENHVFVCLGDSHPFDEEMLEKEFMPMAIRAGGYENQKLIKITIENECGPGGEGWIKIT